MRLPRLPAPTSTSRAVPLWPPLLATRGPGSVSEFHAHHALHFVLAVGGELRAREDAGRPWRLGGGVLTPPDVTHAVDARGCEVILVFLDPESALGAALAERLSGRVRMLRADEVAGLAAVADPMRLMRADARDFSVRAAELLGVSTASTAKPIHPGVRKVLRLLSAHAEPDVHLDALAEAVGLSPGRLMHVFTESIGIPLRPYIAWLKLQRAAGAIASGTSLASAAQAAGFADAAHMSRTFRRMLGASPSELRPRG